jgi:hypothetical protein
MSIAFHRNKKNGQLFLFVVHPRGQQTPKAWALVLYAVYYIVQLGLTIYSKLFFFNSKKRFKRKISIRKLLLSPLSRSVENKTCIAFKRPAFLWWWSSRRFGQLKQSPPFFACVSVCLYTTQMLRERAAAAAGASDVRQGATVSPSSSSSSSAIYRMLLQPPSSQPASSCFKYFSPSYIFWVAPSFPRSWLFMWCEFRQRSDKIYTPPENLCGHIFLPFPSTLFRHICRLSKTLMCGGITSTPA